MTSDTVVPVSVISINLSHKLTAWALELHTTENISTISLYLHLLAFQVGKGHCDEETEFGHPQPYF